MAPQLGSDDGELENFHRHFNSLEPPIKFTLEIGGKSLNFLDLTITLTTLTPNTNVHDQPSLTPPSILDVQNPQISYQNPSTVVLHPQFFIFRKPSNSGVLIHGDSLHPYTHKLAAFNSMIHRLLSVPLTPSAFHAEVSVISDLAVRNNVHVDIHKIVRRKLLRKAMSSR